jgi:hypothetical protein
MAFDLEQPYFSTSALYGTYFLFFQMDLLQTIRILDPLLDYDSEWCHISRVLFIGLYSSVANCMLLHDFINNYTGTSGLGVKMSVVRNKTDPLRICLSSLPSPSL